MTSSTPVSVSLYQLLGSYNKRRKILQASHEAILVAQVNSSTALTLKFFFCCLLIPSNLLALILSNSASLGSYLLFVLMALPQKYPLQMNPQNIQFHALLQVMPSGSAVNTYLFQHAAWSLAALTQPKPAMQQRGTSTGHQIRQRKTRTTFSLSEYRSSDMARDCSDKPPLPSVRNVKQKVKKESIFLQQ